MKRVRGKARAKLLLFGEHAAVYGYPALGIDMPQQLMVELSESLAAEGEKKSRGEIKKVGNPIAWNEALRRLLFFFNRKMQGPEAALIPSIRVESEVPIGLGFGSSAALCVAVLRALCKWHGNDQLLNNEHEFWKMAHEGERFFHGSPSGIDTGLSMRKGMYLFHPRPPDIPDVTEIKAPDLVLLVAAVSRTLDTARLVALLRERMKTDVSIHDSLRELGELSLAALDRLSTRGANLSSLGKLADKAHSILSSLELSSEGVDLLLEFGRDNAALGGKLSGAGGGGALYLIMPERETAFKAREAMRKFATSKRIDLKFCECIEYKKETDLDIQVSE